MTAGIGVSGNELPIGETHGITELDTCRTVATSAGQGWDSVYVSTQVENPYERSFRDSPHILVGLARSGPARVDHNLLADKYTQVLQPGQINIIPPAMPMELQLHRRLHTTHLYLHHSVLTEVAADLYSGDPALIQPVTHLGIIDPMLEGLINAVREAVADDPTASGLYVDHLARAFAARILRDYSNAGSGQIGKSPTHGLGKRQLAQFRDLVEARMNQKLSLNDLSEGSGMTPGHFARLFKQSTGVTPYQYLMHSRVRRARYLLAESALPILRVAAECGFADHVHFTRVFSKVVGTPPAAFRKISKR